MTRRLLERLSLVWIGVATLAIPLRLRSSPDLRARVMARPTPSREPPSSSQDSISTLVDAAVSADLFSVPGTQGPAPAIAPTPSGLPVRTVQRLRLTAIIGPPWRAVLESEGSQTPPVVLEAGDTVHGYHVVRIVSDSIVLRRNREVSRRLVAESWVP